MMVNKRHVAHAHVSYRECVYGETKPRITISCAFFLTRGNKDVLNYLNRFVVQSAFAFLCPLVLFHIEGDAAHVH